MIIPRLLWSEMSVLRGVGSAIGLIACAVSVYSTITPYWAINIQNTGLQQMESKALGLWQFCIKAAASPNVIISSIYTKRKIHT